MATPDKMAKQDIDLRPEKGIFLPAILCVLLISIPMILWPAESEKLLKAVNGPMMSKFGTLYLWFTLGLVGMCFYFIGSRWGDIVLGDPDDKPQYSLISWIAMVFCSAVAGAAMFWAIVEPQWNLLFPPHSAEAMSRDAYDYALAHLLLNWGPNAWGSYFIVALPIAYLFHIRRKPVLRISSAASNVLGKQTNGLIGRLCDICVILALIFCTATTMCISLPTVEAALCKVFGWTPSLNLQLCILAVSACIAGWSVWSGLDKGIKFLSNLNIGIAIGLIVYAIFVGPTSKLFDIFTNAFGIMISDYVGLTFWIGPFANTSFAQDWTIFYALFWAGYSCFMGLFIARISRGRTIREVVGWGLFGCLAGSYLIHGTFGSYTLYAQYNGIVDACAILKSQGGPAAMMAVLDTLPMGKLVMIVYCCFSTIFLATSVDSGCYVISSLATTRMNSNTDPARWHRTLWAGVLASLAFGLLAIGGLNVAKIFGNFSGAVAVLPAVLLVVAWWKILKSDGQYLLCNYVRKECPPASWSDEEE